MKNHNGWVGIVLAAAVMLTTSGCRFRRGRAGGRGDLRDPASVQGPILLDDVWMEGERFEGRESRDEFEIVYFDYDSSMVKVSERAKVERVASAMRREPGMQIVVEGHCDERGSAEYNLALGERRALSVRSYLVGLGVEASRIQTRSFGEERPVASGSNEQAWSQNRRAEFVVIR